MTVREAEHGYALISAVIALAVIMLIISILFRDEAIEADRVRFEMERSQASAYADAIVARSVMLLETNRQERRLRVDGIPNNVSVLGADQTVVIWDEFGHVDINAVPADTLTRLFEQNDIGHADAVELADEIVAWRSGQGTTAAENHDRAGRFLMESELLRFPRMTRQLYEAVLPGITVFSGQPTIEQAVAPLEALLAVPGVDRAQAEQMVAVRRSGGNLSPDTLSAIRGGRVVVGVNQVGWPFRISCKFRMKLAAYRIEAVVRLIEPTEGGYLVLRRTFLGAES